MPRLTLDLAIHDVADVPVHDPTVQVRLGPPSGVGTVSATVVLAGAPVRLAIEDGPPTTTGLILRVTPRLYRDGAVTCTADGDGRVTPMRQLMLPRRPSHWQPSFTTWRRLADPFDPLRAVLGDSPALRVGQFSAPVECTGDAFDAIDASDESRGLAKQCLLNLYGRLRVEKVPGTQRPWFASVRELLLATRERFIAEVDEACWAVVHDLAARGPAGYKFAPVGLHLDNFRAIPGVSRVDRGASVKTTERKANLQFSVARVTRDGRDTYLLDADIDEHGGLLLHTFDLIKHAFTGGTHPSDVHECLAVAFPGTDFGYRLTPLSLVPLTIAPMPVRPRTTARRRSVVVPAAASASLPRRRAAKKR